MGTPKLYAGAKLRETRLRFSMTQKAFAETLGISLPYLNQMERNHRPISAAVVLGLAREFDIDVTELSAGDTERVVSDLREALADPVFSDPPPLEDLGLVASNAPLFARAFLELYGAHRRNQESLAIWDTAYGRGNVGPAMTPWEEVRDFFHYQGNYFDAVDRHAEERASEIEDGSALDLLEAAGITVRLVDETALRAFDREERTLHLSEQVAHATRTFQALHQLALIEHRELLEDALSGSGLKSDEARRIALVGLANYWAGAVLMPYETFRSLASGFRHDLKRLATRFGASIEQVGHRLSTLQRPSAEGVPFFFVRVDQAGNITKRHSATRLQFARFGGACPLWNVHQAFETPGRFLRQLSETPDGVRYITVAYDVTKEESPWGSPQKRYAIALGCEITHAKHLVYADGLAIENSKAFEPIGISCRICDRKNCHQRAVPPLNTPITLPEDERGILPYRF